MRIIEVIRKSTKEQLRSFWILALTVVMAPFFVGVYYLMNETTKPSYDILILNRDKGVIVENNLVNHGEKLLLMAESELIAGIEIPVKIIRVSDKDSAINLLNKKKADALIIIPEGFSDSLILGIIQNRPIPPEVEITGDMNDFNYIIPAIWGSEVFRVYIENITGFPSPFSVKETNLSRTIGFDDFDLYMPGLLVLSVIMLMFSASIAFVTEIENGTILRFRLSGLTTLEFIGGVTVIQLVIGLIAVLITLGTAEILGFQSNGSLWLAMFVVSMAALSIIAFSVILGALTKSSNEILVIGNFPLFLFMFFTGAVFPMEGKAIFNIGEYGINLQGLMSPTHAVSAMKKVMLMDYGFTDILPEILSLFTLTIIYFAIGTWLFNKRHMKFGGI
jgi:ABC-2 type transport system permease protein